jgi:hypothetical protein
MNKRQLKKARRKQIRIYTDLGATPGPFRTIRQATNYAQKHGALHVLRYQFGWRTIRWSKRTVRGSAMWCVSWIRLTENGIDRRPSMEALRYWPAMYYGSDVGRNVFTR